MIEALAIDPLPVSASELLVRNDQALPPMRELIEQSPQPDIVAWIPARGTCPSDEERHSIAAALRFSTGGVRKAPNP